MHIDEGRNRIFELVLNARQNRVLIEYADAEPEVIEERLRHAEETITYGVIDRQIEGGAAAAEVGKAILATYGADWGAIENGREYVERIARNVEFNLATADIAAQIDAPLPPPVPTPPPEFVERRPAWDYSEPAFIDD